MSAGEQNTKRWRIELFGGLHIECEGEERGPLRPKPAELLAHLVLLPRHQGAREVLSADMWPSKDDAATLRHRLSQTLLELRKSLSDDTLLQANNTHIWLNPDLCSTDVGEFQQALEAAYRTEEGLARGEHLRHALSLYAGELLPEQFGDKILASRYRLHDAYLQAQRDYAALEILPLVSEPLPIPAPVPPAPLPTVESVLPPPLVSPPPVVMPPVSQPRFGLGRGAALGFVALLGLIVTSLWPRPDPIPVVTMENAEAVVQEIQQLQGGGPPDETPPARQRRQQRHAELCLALAEAAQASFVGPNEAFWQKRLDRLHKPTSRHTAALEWWRQHDPEKALQLCSALIPYWFRESIRPDAFQQEAALAQRRRMATEILQQTAGNRSYYRARALQRYVVLMVNIDDAGKVAQNLAQLERCCHEAETLANALKNDKLRAQVLRSRGLVYNKAQRYKEALKCYEKALELLPIDAKVERAGVYLSMIHMAGVTGAANLSHEQQLEEWRQMATWGRDCYLLYREVGSDYYMDRALEKYDAIVESMYGVSPQATQQWDAALIEDYRAKALRNPSGEKDCHRCILKIAKRRKDTEEMLAELKWFSHAWLRETHHPVIILLNGFLYYQHQHSPVPLFTPTEWGELNKQVREYRKWNPFAEKFRRGQRLTLEQAVDLTLTAP